MIEIGIFVVVIVIDGNSKKLLSWSHIFFAFVAMQPSINRDKKMC